MEGGESEFLYADGISKEKDARFIRQISNNDPNEVHIIIGDGAGFHHKQNLDNEECIPDNVRVLTISPYSPELNPIDKLWDVIKNEICHISGQS